MAIVAFIVILAFAAPSFLGMPKYSLDASPSFLILAIALAVYTALSGKNRALQIKRSRISIVAALLLNAIRLWSITLFPDIMTSAFAVSGLALLILGIHAMFPRLFIRMWAEQLAIGSRQGKRLVWLLRVTLPGLLLVGTSLGRSIARQHSDQALFILANLSFLGAMLFMHIALSEHLYKTNAGTSTRAKQI
ncbi:MAG: hypothetical protein KIS88_01755 [Anaerolineales bacterium]|nr:hypothetical protein [Anaerolineales bacterium]